MIVIGLIFVFSLFYGISSDLEDKEPFQYAFEVINKDEEMIRHLGSPIVQDGIFMGDMSWSNGEQSVDVRIPVSGPKGEGVLYLKARETNGVWTYQEIELKISDEGFDMLEEDW